WDVREGRELWKASGPVQTASFSQDGLLLAYATSDRLIAVVDAATGSRRWEAVAGARRGELALSPDGQSLAFFDEGSPKEARQEAVRRGMSFWHRGKKVRIARSREARLNRPTFSADS